MGVFHAQQSSETCVFHAQQSSETCVFHAQQSSEIVLLICIVLLHSFPAPLRWFVFDHMSTS